jgi:hypothetical protein
LHQLTLMMTQSLDDHMSYKYDNIVYLTLDGVHAFAQESRNKMAVKNREAVLCLVNEQQATALTK